MRHTSITSSKTRTRIFCVPVHWLALLIVLPLLPMAPAVADAKTRITVTQFENKVQGVFGNWRLGEGMAEMLATELFKSGQFIVLERAAMDDLLREQELGQSGLVRRETAAQTGQMLGAQVIVRGAVTEFSDAASGYGGDIRSEHLSLGGKIENALVGIDLRVIDASSGQILASQHVTKEARSVGGVINYNNRDLQIGAGGFRKTPLGEATRAAIAEAVAFISRTVHVASPGTSSVGMLKIIQFDGRKIYINGGRNRGVAVGDRYMVYTEGEALIDPDTGMQLGSTDEMIGAVEVSEVREKFSIAYPVRGGGFKRGDSLRRQ